MTAIASPPPGRLALPPLDARGVRRGRDRLVVARRASVPLVQVRVLLPGPGGPRARLAAATLLRRAGVLDRLDEVGGTAEASARPDGVLVTASAEPGAAQRLVALLLDLLRPSGPPSADVVAAEAMRLASADTVARRDPAELARRAALARVFGVASPLAEPEAVLHQVGAAQVQEWHATAGDAVLVLCGDVDPAADWGDPEDAPAPPHADPRVADSPVPRWAVQDRPGSQQTTLRAAAPVPAPGSEQRAAAQLLQRLLGGGKGSRMVRELRERRGYGYHPGTTIVDLADASYLLLEADVATEVTGDAVRVVDAVLDAMCTSPPSGEELELGRRGVVGDLARTLDAQGTLADLLLAGALAGAPPAAVPELAAAVAQTTRQQVQASAARLLDGLRGAAAADLSALREQELPSAWGARV